MPRFRHPDADATMFANGETAKASDAYQRVRGFALVVWAGRVGVRPQERPWKGAADAGLETGADSWCS